jgi:predicted amidohydrolase
MPGSGEAASYGDLLITSLLVLGGVCVAAFVVVRMFGRFLATGSRDRDELVVAELDLDQIREVRNVWPFYRDRRPDSYDDLVAP